MIKENKKAFTLIEVLIVISIIGLLGAILMPALTAAQSEAASTVCRSNLRQLAMGSISYTFENKGFFVLAAKDIWKSGDGRYRWHGRRKTTNDPFEPKWSPLVSFLAEGKIKECPERVDFDAGGFEAGCGGYGYNQTYIGSRLWDPPASAATKEEYLNAVHAKSTKYTEVARPSETLMFADCAMSTDGQNWIEYSFAEPPYHLGDYGNVDPNNRASPSIHFRHRGRANIAWVDGHVDVREMGNYMEANKYGVYSYRMNLNWFHPIDKNTYFDLE